MKLVVTSVIAAGVLAGSAQAQWVNDAAVNTLIAGGEGLQCKPKIIVRSDDGAYVSWFSSADAPTYWSLKLNRLKPTGESLWSGVGGGAGIVVSSKTQFVADASKIIQTDYDLKTDSGGNALVAFTDFSVTTNRNVMAHRVSPVGTQMWGAGGDGIAVTNSTVFKRDPRITQTSDGQYTIVWFQQPFTSSNGLYMQRLDSAGTLLLDPAGVAIATNTSSSRPPDRFDMVPSDNGSVIVAWVREFSSSSSALRHIVAQKFGPTGAPIWNNGEPVTICDQSVPFATLGLPYGRVALTATPGGGAALAWFDVRAGANTQAVYTQRIDGAGLPLWAANGVAVSTDTTRVRIDPAITHDSTGTWIFWRELDNATAPTQWGVYAQRIDSAGTRVFGDTGAAIRPMSGVNATFVRASAADGAATAFWFEEPSGPTGGQLLVGSRIDATGAPIWNTGTVTACSLQSAKNFAKHPLDTTPDGGIARDGAAMALTSEGHALLTWQDNRTDADDLFAQRVLRSGQLGNVHATPCIADFDDSGTPSIDDLFLYLNAWFQSDFAADVDSQPGVSIDDLFVFLNAWFTGCP